jgi:hypothetical protein
MDLILALMSRLVQLAATVTLLCADSLKCGWGCKVNGDCSKNAIGTASREGSHAGKLESADSKIVDYFRFIFQARLK